MLSTTQVAVEEKQGISRLEQVVEEISEAERAKELKREQKRLKKKAKRKEKCKCHSQIPLETSNELKEEESPKEEERVCVNENVEETEELNGHRDSWEDDEDDGDSGGSPCSCEDLSNCEQSKSKRMGYRNGDCG